ncbi:MAG: tetratricopeptide repeat protein [Pseudomonadota bacterium]|nr:tetratricopeptide repeat protein [Pseudomonadota bacterium]
MFARNLISFNALSSEISKPPQFEAETLLRELAGLGDPEAQNNLGVLYQIGQFGRPNYARAIFWFQKSAAKGFAKAQFNLGQLFKKGLGVPLDYITAYGWFKKSAEQGFAPAQINLASMYRYGEGVKENRIRALMWYELATVDGNPNALTIRNTFRKMLTLQEVGEAEKLARTCSLRAFKLC